ncbi:DUF4349 domain-containing protein [Noviluteimonas dokdonensis]|uniref:DUF4349 domain-containing protein n=1 Tax=Noviluteimonas dokdonensis TaxID=414050 RepID=UPI0006892C18|nr:DUF4349 domain-containing protein [Lysobacter dokdonensis]
MRMGRGIGWSLFVVVALVGCKRDRTDTALEAARVELPSANFLKYSPPMQMRAPRGTSLAYEHEVEIRMAARDIPARVTTVQQACFAQTVGDCAVLDVRQSGGDTPSASITVRVAPDGIDKLIGSASQGGEIRSRSTHAEDLAERVSANALIRSRLEKEHARLIAFQDKPDVKLGDMLKLSERLAEVEASLDIAKQEQAQQRRRIDTNRLTIDFSTTAAEKGGSAIGNAFRDSGAIMADVVAWLIRFVAGAIPVVILLWGAWAALRRMRRAWKARRA